MKRIVYALLIVAWCSASANPQAAQQKPPAAPAQLPRLTAPETVNVRYEIKLLEEGGNLKPSTKMVTMLATADALSSVRASGGSGANYPLNVDIMPTWIAESRVRTQISIEYNPILADPAAGAPRTPFRVRQSVSVWLENGKPLVVSQSVDPATDRKITFEVTSTIIR